MDVLYAAPVAWLKLVFVSGLLDYSCIPQDMILNSVILKLGRFDVWKAEQEVVCDENVITGS